jgi:hypothetical protein
MKKMMGLILGLSLAVGAFSFALAQDKDTTSTTKASKKGGNKKGGTTKGKDTSKS